MMNRYQCWWCKLFFPNVGPFCSYKEKLHEEFTESDVAEMETMANELYDKVRDLNISDSNPEIQGENIRLNRSTERFRNSSTRALPQQTEHFLSCVNPLLTYCQTRSRSLSDYLDNAQNNNFEKSEGSSGCSFSVPSPGDICREVDKPNPSKAADLGSKEDSSDSALVSPMCEQRNIISVSANKNRDFRSVSSSSAMETPIDGSSVKENESSEEVVERDSFVDAAAVSVAGPSGLQAQPLGRSREKRFLCDITTCRKAFRDRHSLENHHRTHTGEKPFVCDICNREFSQKCSLKKHQVTHTREKTFQCQICPKKFGRNDNLKAHLLTHSNKKPFVCPICRKGFTRKDQLRVHLQTHSDRKNL